MSDNQNVVEGALDAEANPTTWKGWTFALGTSAIAWVLALTTLDEAVFGAAGVVDEAAALGWTALVFGLATVDDS